MTAYPDIGTKSCGTASADWQGPALLLAATAGALGTFWFGLTAMASAWTMPEYSHGPVIPLLSAYLLLVEMRRVPARAALPRERVPGLCVAVAALALGALGTMVRIPDVAGYALILWIWGMVLLLFGTGRAWALFPSVLHLVFMLPLPQFVYWHVSTWLQSVSSEIGVAVIALLGVPVYLDGNIIDLGVYKLQVAEACSGLRYLFPVMSFSYVFGVLYTGPRWHSLVLFAAAAPLTVLMNSLRIGATGLLVDRFGIGQAEGVLHLFEGWVFFAACIAVLFGLSMVLRRASADPRPIIEVLDLDIERALSQVRRYRGIRPSVALVSATVATLATLLAMHALPERDRVAPERMPLAVFPAQIGEWTAGQAQRLSPEIERVLNADDYLSDSFASAGAAAPVDLFVAYYDRQTEGRGIHSPEVCIPAGGWEVSNWTRTTLEVKGAGGAALSLPANRAVIQKGLDRQLVLYWFEQRGRRMTSAYAVKAVTLWDAALTGRTDGALVRLVTPLMPGESLAAAEARMADFLGSGLHELPRFVPE